MISNRNLIFCDRYSIVHLRWHIGIYSVFIRNYNFCGKVSCKKYENIRFSCYSSALIFSIRFINFRSLSTYTHTHTTHIRTVTHTQSPTHTVSHPKHTVSHPHISQSPTHTVSHPYIQSVTHTYSRHPHMCQSPTHTVSHPHIHAHTVVEKRFYLISYSLICILYNV